MKLHLNEDFEEKSILWSQDNIKDINNKKLFDITAITGTISSLIKDEWEAIEGYNNSIISLYDMGCSEEILDILREIASEEYIHIGQLEKTLQLLLPETEVMKDGEEEVEEIIDNAENEKNINIEDKEDNIDHFGDLEIEVEDGEDLEDEEVDEAFKEDIDANDTLIDKINRKVVKKL